MKQGQAVLIVLLVAAVALGFGLSIISRSTTDVKISEQEDQASRAFNAAEAGIEAGLKNLSVLVGTGEHPLPVGGFTGQYSVTGTNVLKADGVSENDVATVVLRGLVNDLIIEWAKSTDDCTGAVATSGQTVASLEISIFDSGGNVLREAVNACNLSLANGLTDVSDSPGDDYFRKITVSVTGAELVRIRPLYNPTQILVTGANLPIQVYQVNSTAQATTLESKAIEVTRTEPAAPAIFDYALFSGTNLVQ